MQLMHTHGRTHTHTHPPLLPAFTTRDEVAAKNMLAQRQRCVHHVTTNDCMRNASITSRCVTCFVAATAGKQKRSGKN